MHNHVNLPEPIRKLSRLADNEVKAYRAECLLALEWRAPKKNNSLVMLSSQSSTGMTSVPAQLNQENMEKPVVVNDYHHSID